jgi:hypothetical protein
MINGVATKPEKVLANLRRCLKLAPTWLQTCWFGLDGSAPSAEERKGYCDLISHVASEIAGIHLYGLARPSLQAQAFRLTRLAQEELDSFAAEVYEKTGVRVIINP